MAMTDDELAEIELVWAAASGSVWRTEQRDKYTKLYAVSPPNMHDSYLLDLSQGDANVVANIAAIGAAPQHVALLLSEVKRLRAGIRAIRHELASVGPGAAKTMGLDGILEELLP